MKQIDRIKSMTTSEMAEYLDNISGEFRNCKLCIAKTYCINSTLSYNLCKQTIEDYLESEVTQ